MPRRSDIRKERHHVYLNEGDWTWLLETYGGSLTPSAVIAKLVSYHRRKVEERISLVHQSDTELELEEDDTFE